MNENPIYIINNLEMSYSGRMVLSLEALVVTNGEVLGLVGPSGAGKSTLLRLMNFLETPTRGSVGFMGVGYTTGQDAPLAERRRVTCVFQHPILLNRSVWDNVAYGLRLRGQRETQPAVEAVLDQVGLQALARQPARRLSGGEAQRVAVARVLVLRPEVLLLDEPTANLDPYNVGLSSRSYAR